MGCSRRPGTALVEGSEGHQQWPEDHEVPGDGKGNRINDPEPEKQEHFGPSHAVADVVGHAVGGVQGGGSGDPCNGAEAGLQPGLDESPEEDRFEEAHGDCQRQQRHPVHGPRERIPPQRDENWTDARTSPRMKAWPEFLRVMPRPASGLPLIHVLYPTGPRTPTSIPAANARNSPRVFAWVNTLKASQKRVTTHAYTVNTYSPSGPRSGQGEREDQGGERDADTVDDGVAHVEQQYRSEEERRPDEPFTIVPAIRGGPGGLSCHPRVMGSFFGVVGSAPSGSGARTSRTPLV